MLADAPAINSHFGALERNIHFESASIHALISFMADQLATWRHDPERPDEDSETVLTSLFCAHLNDAARLSRWDFLQFKVEERDEVKAGRKLDLVASPCGATVWIAGRRCIKYDTLLPVECKRLPTPIDKRRDVREYVINGKTTGGIQRFKAGHHGAAHTIAAMIGYIQKDNATYWKKSIDGWIQDLASASHAGWSTGDLFTTLAPHKSKTVTLYRSDHTRAGGLPDINLTHLWVQMR